MNKLLELFLPPACLVSAFAIAFLVFAAPPFVLTIENADTPAASVRKIDASRALKPVLPRQMLVDFDKRPLFASDRQPPPQQVTDKPITPIGFSVVGIFVSRDDAIIVVRQQSNVQVRLRVGDKIDGWTVQSIQPKAVVFENRGQTREIDLTKPGE